MKITVKIIALALAFILLLTSFAGCFKNGNDSENSSDTNLNGENTGENANGTEQSTSGNNKPSGGGSTATDVNFPSSLKDPEKKKQNDEILAELMPKYEALREEIKARKAGYDLGKEDSSIGTPNSNWNAALPAITEDHPRLLLTKDTLPTVRKSLLEENPTNKRFFELLDQPTSTINNGKLDKATTDYDGRKGLHNYRKDYLEFIQIKALGYLVDGHELYGYQAIHCMKQFLRTLDIQYISSNMEREYGNTMFTAALVYDWCYDLLTEEDARQLRAGIQNKTAKGNCGYPAYTNTAHYKWKMSVGYPPCKDKIGAVSGHGSERQVLRDYLSVAIAFYGDNDSWWNYVGKLVYSEYVPVRNHYFQSGISQQGIGVYVSGRHIADMYSAWMLKTATGSQPYNNIDKTVRNFLGYECAPGKLFSDGDGTFSQQNNYEFRALSYMTAYIFADEAMLAQARDMQPTKAFEADTIELTSAMYVALAGMSDIEPAEDKYDGMELIQYNGSPVGQYITHEAWNDPNSAGVFMKIKELSSANHEHADAGNFMIYYKGMLSADAGVYSGYSSDHTRYYHQATVSHNSLLINNGSQNSSSTDKKVKYYSGGQIWPAEITASSGVLNTWLNSKDHQTGVIIGNEHGYYDKDKAQPKYAYIGGDISGAYPSSTVDFVGRRMLVVYTGDEKVPMAFFTYDTITSDSTDYKKTYLLHISSKDKPTIDTVNKTVVTENGGGRLVLTCLSSNVSIKGVGGRTYGPNNKLDDSASGNYYINGYGQVPINYDDGTWGRVEISNTNSAKSTKLFNAMYVTDAGNTTYYETKPITNVSTNSLSGGDVEGGVFNKSVAAVFVKRNLTKSNRLTGTVSFTTEGNSSMSYYIDGLAAGTWKVTVGGKTIGSYTVSANSGLLTFSAPAGNVTITKA
jgi:hypothetical protein